MEISALINRYVLAFVLLLTTTLGVVAAPTDIVPQGSAVNDWMAALAARGYLGTAVHPSDFTTEQLHSRDQLAHLLYSCLIDSDQIGAIAKDKATAPLAYEAVRYFRDELLAEGADIDYLLDGLRTRAIGYVGSIQAEERVGTGDHTPSGSYVIGRGVAGQELADHYTWVGSASNWAQDWRRNYYNDVGASGFSGFNEGYLRYDGPRGLDIRVGRMFERWGPGLRGSELISDNVPAFDEIRVSFPFSLGSKLGENYRYTQFASSFKDYAGVRYFEGREIEYAFSSQWNLQYQEAFKASFEGSLNSTPMVPYLAFKSHDLSYIDSRYNYNENIGLSYSASPNSRIYAQYFVDDYRSPVTGDLLGLSLGHSNSQTPRRIGYLAGSTLNIGHGTSATLEYAFADPSSNVFQNNNATWERGLYSFIGMPNGPNVQELSGRIGQKVGDRLNLAFDYRDRGRHNRSFPSPTSHELGAYSYYSLTQRSTVGLEFHVYRQDAFTGPVVAQNTNVPLSVADYGENMRVRELDMTYEFTY